MICNTLKTVSNSLKTRKSIRCINCCQYESSMNCLQFSKYCISLLALSKLKPSVFNEKNLIVSRVTLGMSNELCFMSYLMPIMEIMCANGKYTDLDITIIVRISYIIDNHKWIYIKTISL